MANHAEEILALRAEVERLRDALETIAADGCGLYDYDTRTSPCAPPSDDSCWACYARAVLEASDG